MNSAVINTPTTTTPSNPTVPLAPTTPPHPRAWKTLALTLAVVVALLAAAVSFESYTLYLGSGRVPEARPAAAPAAPVAKAAVPAPAAADPLPDWPLPLVGTGTGSSWDRLNLLHQEMDQMFNNTLSQFPADASGLVGAVSSPNFDLREDKDHYTVRADMPGADKSTIKVSVEGRMLTISGQRTALTETQTGDAVRSERNMAQFVRSVRLPGPVKAAAVDAKYDNGVLTLTLPKADPTNASTQVTVH